MTDDLAARYPDVAGRPLAMALMTGALIELGHDDDAYAMGRAALALAPGDTAVRDIVQRTFADSVASFHFSMLRDGPRNDCYAAAIRRQVRPGMRVLEIGTGAGLLAMLAARAGADVVTCETNPLIAAAAREVIARNGLSDRIRVIAKRSTDLTIGTDLPDRCDLLLSELFGDDLFEEGVVPAIADARARLLRADAPILPPRAELRCALVRSDAMPAPLGHVLGFDLAPFAPLASLRHRLPPWPSRHARLMSPTVSALAVDFGGSPLEAPRERIALRSTGGRVDGIAHWLRLDFGDGTTYENAPFASPEAHWLVSLHAFARPRRTAPGDIVHADVRILGRRLIVATANADGEG